MTARRRVAVLCLTLLLPLFAARGQEAGVRTEIIVVGAVHAPTPSFDEKALAAILKRVKPDLVLLELDPSFFDASDNLSEKYQGVSLEAKVATAYARAAGARLRPFDIEGRNRFYREHDYFNREARLNQEVGRLYASGQLSAEARLLFETLLSLSAVRDACGAERPEVVNSSACDTAVERKHHYAFQGLGRVIELTPALKEAAPFWALAEGFWARRNAAMVRNILTHTKELRPGRALVLTGFEHRALLKRRLAELAPAEGFAVREFWDKGRPRPAPGRSKTTRPPRRRRAAARCAKIIDIRTKSAHHERSPRADVNSVAFAALSRGFAERFGKAVV